MENPNQNGGAGLRFVEPGFSGGGVPTLVSAASTLTSIPLYFVWAYQWPFTSILNE